MKLLETIDRHLFSHLVELCKHELELDSLPEIEFIASPTVDSGSSFGHMGDNKIQVVVSNRHPMDVARTLTHELVHWKQLQDGMELDGTTGSEIENQANAIAGIIMRKFGKMYPSYFLTSIS